MLAIASPASLKGVLGPVAAAARLAAGLRRHVDAVEAPVADGGEGTAEVVHRSLGGEWRSERVPDALGRPVDARWLLLPDGSAAVDSAEAVGITRLAVRELDPLRASSAGLGELLLAVLEAGVADVLVGVGGTATVDGGLGLRATVGARLADVRVRVACDVRNPLLGERGAARVFGPQKGADAHTVLELERRLEALDELAPYRELPGAGAGGGLGAAFAALGGELCDGAALVLDTIGFDDLARDADLVVTGEGTVDATSLEGKAPGAVVRRCAELGVRAVLFGGRVRDGVDATALSGDPGRASEDLELLGADLGLRLVERA